MLWFSNLGRFMSWERMHSVCSGFDEPIGKEKLGQEITSFWDHLMEIALWGTTMDISRDGSSVCAPCSISLQSMAFRCDEYHSVRKYILPVRGVEEVVHKWHFLLHPFKIKIYQTLLWAMINHFLLVFILLQKAQFFVCKAEYLFNLSAFVVDNHSESLPSRWVVW